MRHTLAKRSGMLAAARAANHHACNGFEPENSGLDGSEERPIGPKSLSSSRLGHWAPETIYLSYAFWRDLGMINVGAAGPRSNTDK